MPRLFREIVESSQEAIAIADATGRFVYINPAHERLFGRSLAEYQRLDHSSYYPPETAEILYRDVLPALARGESWEGILDVWDANGRRFPLWHRAGALLDRHGRLRYTYSFMHDVSEQQRFEADLRRQREELRKILDAVPAIIMYMDRGDKLLWVNRANAESVGRPAEEIIGRSIYEILPEADVDSYLVGNREVVETGRPRYDPEQKVIVAGEERWAETVKLPYRDAAGEIVGVVVIVQDVTERVRARERLERALADASNRAAELQAVLDNMLDGVFVCDAEGRLLLANEAALNLLGIDRVPDLSRKEGMPGLIDLRTIAGRPVAADDMPIVRALNGQLVVGEDYIAHNSRLGRDVYLRTNAAPIRDSAGRIVGAVTVGHDITRLIELDRMKDQFIAVAAHELKTPVTIMKGYAQILLRAGASLSDPQRRMLDAINRGANRIDRIVYDLLDVSRLRLGRLALARTRFDLAGLVSEVAERFAITEPNHPLRVAPAEPAIVDADRDRIEHVLLNLLSNAARYSPAGAPIDVKVRTSGGDVVVSVADRGVGIPREKQARIFEQFYRAHTGTPQDPGGMGIGLHISREIVERHGGRMWFESEPGVGSTFHFGLPLAPPEPA